MLVLRFAIAIAIAIAIETGVSPILFIICIAVASNAALLSPVATPLNLMVLGPGAYKFSDYTKFGLPIAIWCPGDGADRRGKA